jgi:hypothetical protein
MKFFATIVRCFHHHKETSSRMWWKELRQSTHWDQVKVDVWHITLETLRQMVENMTTFVVIKDIYNYHDYNAYELVTKAIVISHNHIGLCLIYITLIIFILTFSIFIYLFIWNFLVVHLVSK